MLVHAAMVVVQNVYRSCLPGSTSRQTRPVRVKGVTPQTQPKHIARNWGIPIQNPYSVAAAASTALWKVTHHFAESSACVNETF